MGQTELHQANRAGWSRKKSGSTAGVREWVAVDSTGEARVMEAGKYAIMRRAGLQAGDLRVLDPVLAYPSTMRGRERAIVVKLEHIKAIVTAQVVLLLNPRDPSVSPFVEDIQQRLLLLHLQASGKQEEDRGRENTECQADLKVLPFEFVALESCLEAACTSLDSEATTLEQEAHPALDKLTSKINTLNLERVRQIKSRLVDLTGRVQKVRDELEHLLDDDEDMAGMHLTAKHIAQNIDDSSSVSSIDDGIPLPQDVARMPAEVASEPNVGSDRYNFADPLSVGGVGPYGEDSGRMLMGTEHLDVKELEMLLEAYFVEIDGTLSKLNTLREYVEDTEDYLNIMLDDKQNQLLQMGIMLTSATLVLSFFIVLAGIMGMNIHILLFESPMSANFLWTVGGGTAGTIFLYLVAIVWLKQRRLIE